MEPQIVLGKEELPKSWMDIPILYVYVYQYILAKLGDKQIYDITLRNILEVWHRHVYHLPKVYDFYIVKEYVSYGLIEPISPGKYRIDRSKFQLVNKRLNNGASHSSEAPYLYLHIFKKMTDSFGRKNRYVSGSQLISIWRNYIPNIARIYDNLILKEMANYGLIRQVDTQRYIFLGASSSCKLKKLKNNYLW